MLPFLRTAGLRRGPALVARTARSIPHRNYASEVHAVKSSSEMPWIIGSVAFTVPAVIYLMSGSPSSSDHSGKHSSQRVTHDPHSTVGKTVESTKQSLAEVTESAKEKASQVTESVKETASRATAAASKGDVKEEAKEIVEGAEETTGESVGQAKEKTSEKIKEAKETGPEAAETAKEKASELGEKAKETLYTLSEKAKSTLDNIKDKVLPDDPEAPGAENNPRLAAERAIVEENKKPYTDVTHTRQGADATSREAGSTNVQTGKQEGLTDGSTWHAELHHGRGEGISKKAEGVHDTARLKGTVDPKRTGS